MNVLKLLFNPIFLLAAGLHAGLLLIPVAGGSSEETVPAPDPEGESITVTRIPPKQSQPARSGAGPTVGASRPTTTAAAPVAGTKAATGGASQPQTQGGGRRSQGGQRSSRRSSASSNNQPGEPNQTARNGTDDPPGLPDLPANSDEPSSVPVTTLPPEQSAPQAAPTLTALQDGVASQSVPPLLKDFLARLRYSLLETRDVAVEKAQQAWLAQLAEQPGIQVSAPQELEKPLEISYPITIDDNGPRAIRGCLNPPPEQGLVGVVVDADGAIATEPTLLRSSGYKFLNDMALDGITDYADFPDENAQRVYRVPVDINYDQDACVNLAELKAD